MVFAPALVILLEIDLDHGLLEEENLLSTGNSSDKSKSPTTYLSFSLMRPWRSFLKVSFLRSSLGEYFLAQRLRISMIQMADIGVRDCLKGASTFIIRDHTSRRGS